MDDLSRARDLSELVRLHSGLLYRFAYRLCGSSADAEDLVQQAFLSAHRKLDQLREVEHAKGWLCAILRNVYLKSLRKQAAIGVVSLENVAEVEEERTIQDPIDREELQSILNEMPEEFRTPVILYYFQEFSYKEIAEQLDIPLGTVMSRLSRGKQHIRQRLTAREPAIR